MVSSSPAGADCHTAAALKSNKRTIPVLGARPRIVDYCFGGTAGCGSSPFFLLIKFIAVSYSLERI